MAAISASFDGGLWSSSWIGCGLQRAYCRCFIRCIGSSWQFFDEFIRAAGDVFSGRDDGIALLVRNRSLVCFAKQPSRNNEFQPSGIFFPNRVVLIVGHFFRCVWCFFPEIHSESGSDVRQKCLAKLG